MVKEMNITQFAFSQTALVVFYVSLYIGIKSTDKDVVGCEINLLHV